MKGVCAPGHVRTRHAGRGGRSDAAPFFLSSYDLIIYFKIIDAAAMRLVAQGIDSGVPGLPVA